MCIKWWLVAPADTDIYTFVEILQLLWKSLFFQILFESGAVSQATEGVHYSRFQGWRGTHKYPGHGCIPVRSEIVKWRQYFRLSESIEIQR